MVAVKKDDADSASGDGEATYHHAMASDETIAELKLALLSSNQEASTPNVDVSSLPEPTEGLHFDAVDEHGPIDFVSAHDDIQKFTQEPGGGKRRRRRGFRTLSRGPGRGWGSTARASASGGWITFWRRLRRGYGRRSRLRPYC